MKIFAVLLPVAVFFLKSTSLAADAVRVSPSPIELVMNCGTSYSNKFENDTFFETVEFGQTGSTNIAMQVIFRNVGEKAVMPHIYIPNLSIVWDGKEYKQTIPYGFWSEVPLSPHSATRHYYFLSNFDIPPEARTSGRHTVAVRDAFSETNTFTPKTPDEQLSTFLDIRKASEPTKEINAKPDRLIFSESGTLTVFIETPK